ncbi:major facilitator superfamily domain-containing protein [Microdochium trichocladiopsis]|uniref:Major facilitator superfamily domain-containing protein n=1 Tax=Microdochium trichocladiopsis TaxID=1682393 RepID=A0A9P8Y1L4_9PEZI|nr:major facilitator superfamily domain-containing protein [Microdochium trichocladiopsis]KAH7025161.1 major facilitator superfamily domain-containing protein [Microdochium trichocladiopsis]
MGTAEESSGKDDAMALSTPASASLGETSESYYIDPAKERRMMRKFDLYAIMAMGVLYMMSNLDRSNLGNANIAGMPEEIGLIGNQFGTATTLLFATYVPFEGPVAILLKVVGPKPLMTICALCWGCVCLGMSFIQNYHGLYACRLLIGFFEAGLIPCVNVYIGAVYKKSERGQRSSFIFAFSALSSAFGGILAFGLTQIRTAHFAGWRWLFAVEGAITILVTVPFWFMFPTTPTEAWFLTEEEKHMMKLRYASDPSWGYDDEFEWSECLKAFVDPKWYAFFAYQFSINISLYGLTTFMPSIVRGLGYESVTANLMTVPIYIAALFFFLALAWASDRTKLRGPFLIVGLVCLIVGYSILLTVDNLKVRFFACFVAALGIYPTTGLSLMWLQDNVSRHYKRATMVGFTLTLGNTAGVAVGQIFTTETAPQYLPGLRIALGLACFALVDVCCIMAAFTWVNKKRAAKLLAAEQAGTPIEPDTALGDYDVHFRYCL